MSTFKRRVLIIVMLLVMFVVGIPIGSFLEKFDLPDFVVGFVTTSLL